MEKIHIKKDVDALLGLGLSEKEALVYLAALESGGLSITELAKAAKIERTGIYYHIDKLLNIGLLKETINGKRSSFSATDPASLKKILNRKQKELDEILPDMQKIYMKQTSQSVSEYFIGKDRVQAFYDRLYEIFRQMQNSENNIIYCFGHSYRAVEKTGIEFIDYKRPQIQLNVKTKAILPSSQKSKITSENDMDPYMIGRYNLPIAEKRYIKDKSFPSPVVIAGDYITLFDYTNYILSITENKNMASTWKTIFEYVWNTLK